MALVLPLFTDLRHNCLGEPPQSSDGEIGIPAEGTKTAGVSASRFPVPLTEPFSNLLPEGIERLWEVHEYLPDPKRFPLATENEVFGWKDVCH